MVGFKAKQLKCDKT